MGTQAPVRVTVHVRGCIQGVGFRWWTRSRALELGLVGSATNLPDGRVLVVAQGSRAACEQLLTLLEGPPRRGRPGQVAGVGAQWGEAHAGVAGFAEG